jgi:catalase
MRVVNRTDPVYFPNSKGGPRAYPERYAAPSWYAAGEIMRTAFEAHAEDDDFVQVGAMVRDVLDDAARDRLVGNIVGQLLNGVTEPVRQRAFGYLRNVDEELGDRVEMNVHEARA